MRTTHLGAGLTLLLLASSPALAQSRNGSPSTSQAPGYGGGAPGAGYSNPAHISSPSSTAPADDGPANRPNTYNLGGGNFVTVPGSDATSTGGVDRDNESPHPNTGADGSIEGPTHAYGDWDYDEGDDY